MGPISSHNVPVLETQPLEAQPSLPILSSSHGRSSSDDVQGYEGLSPVPAAGYELQAPTPRAQSSSTNYAALPTPIGSLLRSWLVIRWRLSRSVFAVPLPLLTAHLDVKLGDLILTLPLSLVLIAVTAIGAKNRDVAGTGTAPTIAMLMVFAFAVRNNSVLLTLTGISFERALLYHKVAAVVTLTLTGLHGLAYVLARNNNEEQDQSSRAFSGIVAFGAMVVLFLFSLGPIRRRFFEFFVRVHWMLFIVVIVFAVIHGAGLALVGVVPWLIDMLFRLAYRPRIYAKGSLLSGKKAAAHTSTDLPANVVTGKRLGVIARDQLSASALPGDVVEIKFPRVRKDTGEEFKYEAGQFAFLCIPAISSLQWHPFTISSSPHEPMVTFHIKALGDWTKKLQSTVFSAEIDGSSRGGANASPFDVLVDGPYGNVSIDIESASTYSHFALISGGIGVTPMRSIVNWLHHEVTTEGRAGIERVQFVWSVRDRDTIEAMVGGGDHSHKPASSSYFPHDLMATQVSQGGVFSSEIYLTRGERDLEGAWVDQQLESCLRFNCRPDIAATLRSLGEQATQSGKHRVAVLVCGPSAMVHQVIAISMALGRDMKVRFDVHSELFEF
ncbi:putative ferric reductase [Phytophthora cinnamomi]|uniref:putative ferric reductase n=1 Tax=Phytophthora cinnamomi TaxID=4785 RepID=UPI00355A6CAB|nr:putative ferric reductase [Phytophthora cinnamomi]